MMLMEISVVSFADFKIGIVLKYWYFSSIPLVKTFVKPRPIVKINFVVVFYFNSSGIELNGF